MSSFLALAFIVSQTTLPSGQAAADRMKSLLASFGVAGSLRLQSLSTSFNPQNDFTHVVVTDKGGRSYEAYMRRDRIDMWRGKESEVHMGFRTKPAPRGSSLEGQFGKWMAAYKTKEPIRRRRIETDGKAVNVAEFSILRNGYPFVVSWQRYGYTFTSDSKGRFVAFHAQEYPPPVDPRPPVLNEADALKRVAAIYRAMQPRDHRETLSYQLLPSNKLGYFLPKGELKARLVWRIPMMRMSSNQFGSRGGDGAMLIDARTGEEIHTDVVP